MPSSRGSSQPEVEPGSPALQADSLPSEPLGKPKEITTQSNYNCEKREKLWAFMRKLCWGDLTSGEAPIRPPKEEDWSGRREEHLGRGISCCQVLRQHVCGSISETATKGKPPTQEWVGGCPEAGGMGAAAP